MGISKRAGQVESRARSFPHLIANHDVGDWRRLRQPLARGERAQRQSCARTGAGRAGRFVFFSSSVADVTLGLIRSPASIVLALPYTWRQQLGDVDIDVPVPKGTRGRDLTVIIQKKKLSVGLKGKEPIMSGELCKDIKVDDSTWTLGNSTPWIYCSWPAHILKRTSRP